MQDLLMMISCMADGALPVHAEAFGQVGIKHAQRAWHGASARRHAGSDVGSHGGHQSTAQSATMCRQACDSYFAHRVALCTATGLSRVHSYVQVLGHINGFSLSTYSGC